MLSALAYSFIPVSYTHLAADKTSGSKKEENVYAIGMDAQGGICSTVVTYTNLSGKLESTPEQPTMTGYTFDGWYTEPVGCLLYTSSGADWFR